LREDSLEKKLNVMGLTKEKSLAPIHLSVEEEPNYHELSLGEELDP
jgi:hypothetical protein